MEKTAICGYWAYLGRRKLTGGKSLLAAIAALIALPGSGWADDLQDSTPDIAYFGGGDQDYSLLFAPSLTAHQPVGLLPREQDIVFGIGWRPDISGATAPDARRASRSIAGGEIDRIGVRTDLTALLFDDGAPSTAWRVSGSLGYTSLSLASDSGLDANVGNGGLLWDIGVGWTSGSISLNAGYQSASRTVGGIEEDMAVLSFGADYSVLPGLSVYGEFNVIDDPSEYGSERLGTVVIVGTGVNF